MNKKLIVALVVIIVVAAGAAAAVYFLATKKPTTTNTPHEIPTTKNNPPVAIFSTNVTKAYRNVPVGFDATKSYDPDRDVLTFSWTFGDGTNASGDRASHSYDVVGNYTVILTVSDGKSTNSSSKVVGIANARPVINSAIPNTASVGINEGEGQNFSITASNSDGDPLTYSWMLDNKTVLTNATRYTFTAGFESSGEYKVKVIISDGLEEIFREWQLSVRNVNRAPSIVLVEPFGNASVAEGATLTLRATAEDPDKDLLTYVWVLDGNVKDNGTGNIAELNFTPDFRMAGLHAAKVTFSDGPFQVAANWSITVRNTNRAPVITNFTPEQNTTVNETVKVQFRVTASDPDGDQLIYNWTLDAVPLTGISGESYDLLTNFSSEGSYKVALVISDGKLDVALHWNITVVNLNRPPVAKATVDIKSQNLGLPFTFNASQSSDPDGDPISFFWEFGDGGNSTDEIAVHTYFKSGNYKVNLTVTDICGTSAKAAPVQITVRPGLLEGWSMGPFSGRTEIMAVGDVDSDGKNELVAAVDDGDDAGVFHGHFTVYDIATHTEEWRSADIGTINDLILANLDGDSALEIIVGTTVSMIGDILSMNLTGNLLVIDGASHAVQWEESAFGAITSVKAADVDGDLQLDIVAGFAKNLVSNATTQTGNYSGGLAVFSATHSLMWNSSEWGATIVLSAQNMDTDAYMEVTLLTMRLISLGALGTNQTNLTVVEWRTDAFYTQGVVSGNIGLIFSCFDVSDVNNDNNKEIIVGTSEDDGTVYTGTATAYSPSMSQLWKSANIGGVMSLKAADVDPNSPDIEILVGTAEQDQGALSGKLIVYTSTWTELWKTPSIGFVMSLGVGDPNNDGLKEILVGAAYFSDSSGFNASYNSTIHVYSGLTRQELSNQTGFHEFTTSFILLDADNDGIQELIFAEWLENALACYIRMYGM
jgi:PKD repeat protein